MELSLKEHLAGIDQDVIHRLVESEIRSVTDAKLLTREDFAELGFPIGVRNKLLKIFSEATTAPPSLMKKQPVAAASTMAPPTSPAKKETPRASSQFEVSKDLPYNLALFLAAVNYESETDPAIREKRSKLYSCWDTNGNGFLSLAEVDLGLKTTLVSALGTAEGDRIWKRFRKCYIRAFSDAKDAAPDLHRLRGNQAKSLSDDDFVSRREFRLLFSYLRIYATWYELFALLDGGSEGITVEDDDRISRQEWIDGLPMVSEAGRTWAPYAAIKSVSKQSFDEIDTDGGGYILLTEWCAWFKAAEAAAGTADGKLLTVGDE